MNVLGPVLKSEVVTLRPFNDSDAQVLFKKLTYDVIDLGSFGFDTLKSIQDWVTLTQNLHQTLGPLRAFAIEHKNQLVGACIAHLHSNTLAEGEVNIAYFILKEFRGQKLATHAAELLCDWVKVEFTYPTLVIRAVASNTSSKNVARRLNFTYSGKSYDDTGRELVVYKKQL